eukprot:1090449-Rhodomonas_salina.1
MEQSSSWKSLSQLHWLDEEVGGVHSEHPAVTTPSPPVEYSPGPSHLVAQPEPAYPAVHSYRQSLVVWSFTHAHSIPAGSGHVEQPSTCAATPPREYWPGELQTVVQYAPAYPAGQFVQRFPWPSLSRSFCAGLATVGQLSQVSPRPSPS